MDVVAELQRLRDYREQLKECAKPGFGPFERYKKVYCSEAEEELIRGLLMDPGPLEDQDVRDLVFDYYISFPLLSVLECRARYNGGEKIDEMQELKQQLETLEASGQLSQEDIGLLPDLLHTILAIPADGEPQDIRFFQVAKKGIVDILKSFLPGRQKKTLRDHFSLFAQIGRNQAVVCFINNNSGVYRSFEWEIIEGILRSPYFPDLFEECEREAGTPEIPYKYRNWPQREFFLQNREKGVVNSFILRAEILKDFETDEGYQHFKDFMDFVALCGEINCNAYMEALLQLFTGFHFDDASRVVKWSGKNVRVLFYILKYISNEKGRYQRLQPDHGVEFPGISGTDEGFFIGKEVDPGNRLQDGKGIPVNILESLHNYYDFFPAPREKQS